MADELKPILKLKVYSTGDKLPKLKEDNRSTLLASDTVICYWKWKRITRDSPVEVRLGRLLKHKDGELYWQVEGITGQIEVVAWAYIKQLPII